MVEGGDGENTAPSTWRSGSVGFAVMVVGSGRGGDKCGACDALKICGDAFKACGDAFKACGDDLGTGGDEFNACDSFACGDILGTVCDSVGVCCAWLFGVTFFGDRSRVVVGRVGDEGGDEVNSSSS